MPENAFTLHQICPVRVFPSSVFTCVTSHKREISRYSDALGVQLKVNIPTRGHSNYFVLR